MKSVVVALLGILFVNISIKIIQYQFSDSKVFDQDRIGPIRSDFNPYRQVTLKASNFF